MGRTCPFLLLAGLLMFRCRQQIGNQSRRPLPPLQ